MGLQKEWAFPRDWIITMQFINNFWLSQAIYESTKLGISELLKDGPQEYKDIARAIDAEPDSLYRLMNFLASYGIYQEKAGRVFYITPFSKRLIKGSDGSLYAWTLISGEVFSQAGANLTECIKTGKTPRSLYNYLERTPNLSEVFDEAMAEIAAMEDDSFFNDYDFSEVKSVVDIGGGRGNLLKSILKKNSFLKGVILDQDSVINRTMDGFEDELKLRCEFVAGDFFIDIPANNDLYIMRKVLHNWDDEDALKILKNCHRAMSKNSKLFIIDLVLPCDIPFVGEFLALNAMVIGGKERFKEEYEDLLHTAGFYIENIISTKCQNSIIEVLKN